jgi:hypothetical protein
MKLEDFRIGQKVMIQYSSEDWYPDWQHDLGPHKIFSLYLDQNGTATVGIETNNGWRFTFDTKHLEEYKEPSRLDSVDICPVCVEAILECSCH